MSFNFDITGTPPALSDITEKREQAVNERAVFRKKNIRFMITMLIIVVVYVTSMIVYVIPIIGKAEPDWAMAFYFLPYFTFVIFIVGNNIHIKRIEKPSKLLDATIIELNEVKVDEISRVIDDKEHPAEITSYLERVAAQGRSLVRAEIDAIQKLHDTNNLVNQPVKRSKLSPRI